MKKEVHQRHLANRTAVRVFRLREENLPALSQHLQSLGVSVKVVPAPQRWTDEDDPRPVPNQGFVGVKVKLSGTQFHKHLVELGLVKP